MTGQPEAALRASAMNALAHGADSLYTPFANPVSRMAALRGAELIATALDQEREERDRAALALGSILCGYAIDSGMFALHHVVCQTLVRVCGSPHAATNAAILPRAMAFMVAAGPGPLRRPRRGARRPSPRTSKPASSSSAATRRASAPSAPTAPGSTRRSTRCCFAPSSPSRRTRPPGRSWRS